MSWEFIIFLRHCSGSWSGDRGGCQDDVRGWRASPQVFLRCSRLGRDMQTFPRKREYGNFRHQAKIDCIQENPNPKWNGIGKELLSMAHWNHGHKTRGTPVQESFTDSVFPAKIHYANSSLKPSHLSGTESDSMRRCRVFVLSRKYFWLRLKHDFTHFSQSWLIYFETIDILSVRLCHVMIHRFYLGFNILADYLHFATDILESVFFLQKYTK